MALVSSLLAANLTRVFSIPAVNGAQKAIELSYAYQTYSATAMAGVLLPVFVGIEATVMAGRIIPAMSNANGTAVQMANAIASGVESFWLLPPVPFALGPVAGVVTSFPGKGVLVGQLTSIFSTTTDQAVSVAQRVAQALDVATRTVIVTFAPPPGSTAPLT